MTSELHAICYQTNISRGHLYSSSKKTFKCFVIYELGKVEHFQPFHLLLLFERHLTISEVPVECELVTVTYETLGPETDILG